MKRKELRALFNEVSSKVSPMRGIYQSGSSDKERKIVDGVEDFIEDSLVGAEKNAIKGLFLSSLDRLDSEEELLKWYEILIKHFNSKSIPDEVYIRLMAVVNQKKYTKVQQLIKIDWQEA